MQEKSEMCQNLNLINSKRKSVENDINVTFISFSKASALDFKQLYVFYKFYQIKLIYLALTFNCSS